MTSPRLEEYARRAKLPIRVMVWTGYSVDYERIAEPCWLIAGTSPCYAFDPLSANAAYLQAVKELTE